MATRRAGAAAGGSAALVRIRGANGETLGTACPVDRYGTLMTCLDVVDGRPGSLAVPARGGDAVPLAGWRMHALRRWNLALLTPDPVAAAAMAGLLGAAAQPLGTGRSTRLVALPVLGRGPRPLTGSVAGTVTAVCAGRSLPGCWRIESGRGPGLPAGSVGGPVVDAETGAVVGVLLGEGAGAGGRGGGAVALPLGALLGEADLVELLRRNAVSVPAFGRALNLAGVLELTGAQLSCAVAGGAVAPEVAAAVRAPRADGLVERWAVGGPSVLAVVGGSGTGRSTELAALVAARPARLPAVRLRGAELRAGDRSLGEAVERAMDAAAVRLGVPRVGGGGPGAAAVCRMAAAGGHPLSVLLDSPEEAPPALLPDLEQWCRESAEWLRSVGARLAVGCGPEFWEWVAEWFAPAGCVRLGEGLDVQPLAGALLARVRRAEPQVALRRARGGQEMTPAVGEVFEAQLSLLCLRAAERIAVGGEGRAGGAGARHRGVGGGSRGRAAAAAPGEVRRLAVRVAGRVHEAARRALGPGQGGLRPEDFAELFPAGEGWAGAVLGEGLLVPVGPDGRDGYRFPHEAFGDWLQAHHLDLDAAFRGLLGDGRDEPRPPGRAGGAVPGFRAGVVEWALLRVGERNGPEALDPWLARLAQASDLPGGDGDGDGGSGPVLSPCWWAGRLLSGVLLRVPDLRRHRALLRALAERLAGAGGREAAGGSEGRLGLGFWLRLRLSTAERVELLLPAARAGWDGVAEALAGLLGDDPSDGTAALCRWLAEDGGAGDAADLAERVLWERRRCGLDELVEALVERAAPRADRMLVRLAAAEPSALCRAVDRWAHDPRPERHVAAAVHAVAAAAALDGQGPARVLLRYAAEAVLEREGERTLHGAVLAVLMHDESARARHLPAALNGFREGDPFLPAAALVPALETCSRPVLAAYAEVLRGPAGPSADAVLEVLAGVDAPDARAAADLLMVRHLDERPDAASRLARCLDARLARGPAARGSLLPLVRELVRARGPAVRRALVPVLAGPEPPLRQELLDELLAVEDDPDNLELVLDRVAAGDAQLPARVRQIVRTVRPRLPADRLDLRLVRCARGLPGFAELLGEWLREDPAAEAGPRTRRLRELLEEGMPVRRAAGIAEAMTEREVAEQAAARLPAAGRGVVEKR
jgi:hypothetical protein